uniref:RecA family profile 1 domain-containing protein n=1 Tax=Anopheles dirus TaxID=7168 RepID=A0A182N7M9_9DIPT
MISRSASGLEDRSGYDLDANIFPDGGLRSGELVEIVGESNSGKSLLLLELIARAILPANCGGLGLAVVLLDCENSYHGPFLLSVMEKHILNQAEPTVASTLADPQRLQAIQRAALERLHLITCYSLEQFDFSLLALPSLFVKHPDVTFVLIDSIATFYWTKCTPANLIRQETYHGAHCKTLRKVAREWGKPVLFTKPAHFGSRQQQQQQQQQRDFEMTGLQEGLTQMSSFSGVNPASANATNAGTIIDHRIELCEIDSPSPRSASGDVREQRFTAFVSTREKQYVRFYLIDKFGFNWIES